jgi:hypothetical protein
MLHRWPDAIGEKIKPDPIDWSRWRAQQLGAAPRARNERRRASRDDLPAH